MKVTDTEMYYYQEIKKEFETEEYNELVDILFHYMRAYVNGWGLDACIFQDECENLVGIREHDDMIELIKQYTGR
jgi:hypothetical protein